jgi:lipid-A-disaccharide synthase
VPEAGSHPHFFLSAAEPSADIHCARLIAALRQLHPAALFTGLGGDEMARAGCTLLANTTSRAAMTYNVMTQLSWYRDLIRSAAAHFRSDPPDLVIVCDSPALNFHIAKAAHKSHKKTLFYVAPQLWAWAPWRIRKLKRLCDKLCCILPFEEKWFASRGLEATYVGNPLFADLDLSIPRGEQNFFAPRVALMPGSRKAEIDSLWPAMQEVAQRIAEKFPATGFTAVAVNDDAATALKSCQLKGLEIDYSIRSVYETARRSDLALVASGSATLQVAAAACPMAIMYQSSPLLWHLVGRWLINIPYLSLVNILADRRLVPEFMPYFKSTDPIAEECLALLQNPSRMHQMSASLDALTRPFKDTDASANVARIASDMLA